MTVLSLKGIREKSYKRHPRMIVSLWEKIALGPRKDRGYTLAVCLEWLDQYRRCGCKCQYEKENRCDIRVEMMLTIV
jgi:hypothetical protein